MPGFIFHTILATFRIFNRYKLRTGLTLLGIVIGIASVIIMVSIGQGARAAIQAHVATEGVNIIYVLPAPQTLSGVRKAQGELGRLTLNDAQDLKEAVPLLRDICWWRRDPTRIVYRNRNVFSPVYSIAPSCISIKNWSFVSGGAITQGDADSIASVALLGQTVIQNLFDEDEEPVGTTIRIKNVPFQVTGRLAPKGHAPGGYDQDDIVFIPFSTGQRKVHGAALPGLVEVIAASTYGSEDLPQAAQEMREVLRARHRLEPEQSDDFMIKTQLEIERFYEGASQTLTTLLLAVASISLLAGGVGVTNMVLVSVTERTREIGVRMAVGAKRRHILMQFLIEAMTLSLMGGCLGILFGILGARLTTVIAGWPTIISGNTVAAAFFFSVAVGLFFGLYPANKASRLNPIEALRYE